MNDNNPYSPPQSDVTPPPPPASSGELLAEPRSLPASAAFQWLTEGWRLAQGNWGVWILILLALFAIKIVIGLIPGIGGLVSSFLEPVFMGGLLIGIRSIDGGEHLRFDTLFEGFKQKFAPLLGLGALTFGIMLLIAIVFIGIFFVAGNIDDIHAGTFDPEAIFANIGTGLLAVGVILGLVLMALFWFTTQLVSLNDVPVFQSLGISFKGCLRNPLALLLYIITVGLLIALIFGFPMGLMFTQISALSQGNNGFTIILALIWIVVAMFVLSPVLISSMYTSYKQIFIR